MTTRRSRLKAVANLPVRRKIATQETVNDINTSNNSTLENDLISISNVKNNNDVLTCNNLKSDTNVQTDIENIEFCELKKSPSKNNNNDNNCEALHNCLKNNPNNIVSKEVVQNENISVKESKIKSNNFNNSSKKPSIKLHSGFENSSDSSNVSSLILENKCQEENSKVENVSEKLVNTEIFFHNENIDINLPEKSVPCLPASNFDKDISPPAISTSLLLPDNNFSKDDNIEFNEVSLYKNLVEQTDLYVNLPRLVDNKTTEIDPEEPEPILTTLVNCYTGNSFNELKSKEEKSLSEEINKKKEIANVKNSVNYSHNIPITQTNNDTFESNILRSNLMGEKPQDSFANKIISSKKNITAVKRKRAKCSDFTKKLADARREFQKKYEKTKPDRSTLKMIDLIFYNPTTNPMESKSKSEKCETALQGETIQEKLAEEDIDEPMSLNNSFDSSSLDANDSQNSRLPVPQLKIGSNGEIILDEKSVIIETSDAKKNREDLLKNSVPIFEDKGTRVSYYRSKSRKTRDWTDFETKRFYKALNTIGPDFSLMQKYFPKRSRLELKNKFKREERLNRSLIDRALINPSEFDMTRLENELAVERRAEEKELEMRLNKSLKEKVSRRSKLKSTFFAREMSECEKEIENNELNKSDNIIPSKIFQSEKEKKNKEFGFIFQKIVLNELEKEINEQSEISNPTTDLFFAPNYKDVI
ncbi:transcription factor TFIIIB B'' component, putative [Pediculus humanus corporis]|uniref:Transcription factor TFIIIB B'' component, putative n=1 Tax=Pediculus humanus subsp. corporis TaxID=121224 RepID=E0W2H5_PEDHC|nr:transcription factor TFIIIB B'' component, putative [Pediculus humanus corporis]EEB19831.1 transcription factor TFIIIB B'' component, putative [Pediculus humanus corporis]